MSVRSNILEPARPTEEVTASSPGHRQKSVSSTLEPPAKMATPECGMGTTDGGEPGGEDGDGGELDGGGDNGGELGGGSDGGDGCAKGHGSPE